MNIYFFVIYAILLVGNCLNLYRDTITNYSRSEIIGQGQTDLIGIIENFESKEYARLLFKKVGNQWIPISDDDALLIKQKVSDKYAVFLNGKSTGTIQINKDVSVNEKAVFLFERLDGVSKIRINKNTFESWSSEIDYRPLVITPAGHDINSCPLLKDELTKDERRAIIKVFRNKISIINTCRSEVDTTPIRIEYRDKDVEIKRQYKFHDNVIIMAELNRDLSRCDGLLPAYWSTFWYVKLSNNDFQLFFPNFDVRSEDAAFIELVDIGDYDADGKYDALFWYSKNNEDGYILYYQNFQKFVTYGWHYH
jgi:hypothetical protein